MIDAVSRHPGLSYFCFQHEQAAAMAADAIWRIDRSRVGVTIATSGPGATNIITGIACSHFDSIPSIHITGQVNMRESAEYVGANVRQIGFQETNIVDMVRPITKYSVMVRSGDELKRELEKAYQIATSGRMGPVLIDVPMDVQQDEVGEFEDVLPKSGDDATEKCDADVEAIAEQVKEFLGTAERPMVLFGAGIGLAGVEDEVSEWLRGNGIPFVSSWNGTTYFDHDIERFCGNIGVYGNRGANYAMYNCDALLVFGSRLDNRQRSGNPNNFVPFARVMVLDVDGEELKKYRTHEYQTARVDFRRLPEVLRRVSSPPVRPEWSDYISDIKERYFDTVDSTYARQHNTLSPYSVVRRINRLVDSDAIVAVDTGATLCWMFQAFHRKAHTIFTDGGNSAMGYSLAAAIGAKIEMPEKQVVCIIGDGGFQVNIQELQTLMGYGLAITIIVFNNHGYGIIKQFQDSNMDSRYEASGKGYSDPDFVAVAKAYGLDAYRVENVDDLRPEMLADGKSTLIEVNLDENTLIEPKVEKGRPINDQFPQVDDDEFEFGNRFIKYERS